MVRGGRRPRSIVFLVPSAERGRAPSRPVRALGIPFMIEGRVRPAKTHHRAGTPGPAALRAAAGLLLNLYGYLRSALRLHVLKRCDFLEGRSAAAGLRARHRGRRRGGSSFATESLLPPLEALRSAPARRAARACGRCDAARGARPRSASGRRSEPGDSALRCDRAPPRRAGRLARLCGELLRTRLSMTSSTPRFASACAAEPAGGDSTRAGPHTPLRRRFLLGLEEGTLRGAATPLPFFDDYVRASLIGTSRSRLVRPDPVERGADPRPPARARPAATLVREAATDQGTPRSRARSGRGRVLRAEDVRAGRPRPPPQLTWQRRATSASGYVLWRCWPATNRSTPRLWRLRPAGAPAPAPQRAFTRETRPGQCAFSPSCVDQDAVQRDRARAFIDRRPRGLRAPDRRARSTEGRRHAVRPGRAHDAAPLHAGLPSALRERPGRGEQARTTRSRSSASAQWLGSAASRWR